MDWSKLPDVGAVALLAAAFATVARRSQTRVSGLWLSGWILIVLHFAAFLFAPAKGLIGIFATFIGITTLAAAGIVFIWASVPYRQEISSRVMAASVLITNTLYIGVLIMTPGTLWALTGAAILLGAAPLAVAMASAAKFTHPLRRIVVAQYSALAIFLLVVQGHPDGSDLALNGLLFTVYMGCCLHFVYSYRHLGTGAFVTTAGFLAWAAVFVVAPCLQTFFPGIHVENEVWNLPKYIVAVGMILVVLEEQIEHNKHLALHDELTGLPNRRLFQDRLNIAIERARRTGAQTALLLIDLDRFKQVNDTAGHHFGDQVLQHVAQIFLGRIRRSDTVARTGGDEFSIILEEPISRDDAERVSRSLIDLLQKPIALDGHQLTVGASIGVALFPEDANSPEALRISADLRMYTHKYDGRSPEFRRATGRAEIPAGQPAAEIRTRA